MSNIRAMIDASRNSNPVELQTAFAAEMQERVGAALSEFRADVVANMFNVGQDAPADENSGE